MSPLPRATYTVERSLYAKGLKFVVGVDEAGSGAWAGPVYAGAVILKPEQSIVGIRDSKRLTRLARERLAREIKRRAVAWAIGFASHHEIDTMNIRQAGLLAMKRALANLACVPEYVLSDAFMIQDLPCPCRAIIRGDARVRSIAAASIIAKVERDALMHQLDTEYPEYGFSAHKGYGTKRHERMLKRFGPSAIHRKSYKPVKKYET